MTAHSTREIAQTKVIKSLKPAAYGQNGKCKTRARVPFTEAEDEQLKRWVSIFGENCWRVISLQMPERTAKQCKERYFNSLAPNLKNGEWTADEEDLLIQKVAEYGTHWSTISQFFKNRGVNNIKNHWNRVVSKKKTTNVAIETKNEEILFDQFDDFHFDAEAFNYVLTDNLMLADML